MELLLWGHPLHLWLDSYRAVAFPEGLASHQGGLSKAVSLLRTWFNHLKLTSNNLCLLGMK